MLYSLVRKYRIKWWDKCKLDCCSVTNLEKWIQTHQHIMQFIAVAFRAIPPIQTKNSPLKNQNHLVQHNQQLYSRVRRKKKGKKKSEKILEIFAMQIFSCFDEDEIA